MQEQEKRDVGRPSKAKDELMQRMNVTLTPDTLRELRRRVPSKHRSTLIEQLIRQHLGLMDETVDNTCGCTSQVSVCEEGKRLEQAVSNAYRAGLGLYGRSAKQANKSWVNARDDYANHAKRNHND